MSRAPDYGAAGRFGLLTPPANPTVEPEFRRLMPGDTEFYVARLTSPGADPAQRLVDYLVELPATLRQYDTLRLDAVAFACTGSSYLVGAEREAALVLGAEGAFGGTPVETAARAIRLALGHLGARRIALVSPYPDWLRDAGLAYWREAGLEVTATASVPTGRADTRGIYELQSADAAPLLASLELRGADAVVVSGTGLPSLALLAERALPVPVVSSNLCLAWRLCHHARGWRPRPGELLPEYA